MNCCKKPRPQYLGKMESGSHEKLWRDSLRKYFGTSSVVKKTAQLHDDITCLSRGLKRSLLLDYLRPDPTALQRFLQSLGHHDSLLSHMTILVVNGDVFLMHKPCALDRTIQIVDISNNSQSGHISLLSEDVSVKIKHQMRDWLETAVPSLSTSGVCVVSELQPCPINLCSLYGWLVGYPSVYWFEESSGYSLDCVELSLWTVLARNESGTIPHLQQRQPLWQSEHLLYSFSTPASLDSQLTGHVQDWFQGLQTQANTSGLILFLKNKRVCLPHITL